jgi:dCMP deaminase|tara:strand:+ start:803 stop:1252 length:450 start_codon:yes stop_codon:yes gene_type:complete
MKAKFSSLYIDIAHRVAELSVAKRLKVGAVVVKDDTVISYGYNGTPSGWDNNCENTVFFTDEGRQLLTPMLKTKPEVLHAESNAIAKLAKSNNSGLDADIFITHAPCIECAKLIFQSGIRKVYYAKDYRDDSGIKFLKKSKVEVVHLHK